MHMEKQAILEYILHILCVFPCENTSKGAHLAAVQLPVKYTCAKVPQTQVNIFLYMERAWV